MLSAARVRFGDAIADDDEADARWLLAYTEAELLPPASVGTVCPAHDGDRGARERQPDVQEV